MHELWSFFEGTEVGTRTKDALNRFVGPLLQADAEELAALVCWPRFQEVAEARRTERSGRGRYSCTQYFYYFQAMPYAKKTRHKFCLKLWHYDDPECGQSSRAELFVSSGQRYAELDFAFSHEPGGAMRKYITQIKENFLVAAQLAALSQNTF